MYKIDKENQKIPTAKFSASERRAAQYLADKGHHVVSRLPVTQMGVRTSDLLVDGIPYDVYTPKTINPSRIISAIAKKNSQAQGIVLDLTETEVTPNQLGNVLERVQGAGATNICDIVIIEK